MNTVEVKKSDLIKKLKDNRKEHRSEFLKAQEGFRNKVIEVLDKRLAEARDGKNFNTYFNLPEPKDYTDSYDTALEMLEWEVDDTVKLTQQQFKQLVMNEWEWMDVFNRTNSTYTAS